MMVFNWHFFVNWLLPSEHFPTLDDVFPAHYVILVILSLSRLDLVRLLGHFLLPFLEVQNNPHFEIEVFWFLQSFSVLSAELHPANKKKCFHFRDFLRPSQNFPEFPRLSETIGDFWRFLETYGDFLRLSETIWHFWRLSETFTDFWRLSKTFSDFQRLSETVDTFRDFQRLS